MMNARSFILLLCLTLVGVFQHRAFSQVPEEKLRQDSTIFYKKKIESEKQNMKFFERQIIKERRQLIKDIEILKNIFPLSQYNSDILLRLAELTYEDEIHEFDKLLDEREMKLEAAEALGETINIPFPSLNFERTIKVYDEILGNQLYLSNHDIALFYKALCLIQSKDEDGAVQLLTKLTDKFPKSEFYVKSLIKVGDYYFNRPFFDNGKGYNLAEAAYSKAILHVENPDFPEAMYKLGWCYFQQDRFREAINTFQTLIEKSNLNFASGEGSQLVDNPLLRDDAVEFLAISLDESGTLHQAHDFLKIIGDENYTSKVLIKLSEIYTQQSDYTKATEPLMLVLEKYPMSEKAPEAKLALIKAYTQLGKQGRSDEMLMEFFDTYSKGSEWYRKNLSQDVRSFVDSQAVKILIKSSEKTLAEAHESKDRKLYIKVAKSYNRLLEEYPGTREAYEVQWNLSLILDKHINNPNSAFFNYMQVATKYPFEDYRKKALLSAISVAQRQWLNGQPGLEEDSTINKSIRDTSFSALEKDILLAVQKFFQYYPNEPEMPEILLLEATIYYNRTKFAIAIPLFKNILAEEERPKNYQEVLKLLSQSYMAIEDFDEAEIWYTELAETAVNPEYAEMGQRGQVEAGYRRAEKLEKSNKFLEAGNEYLNTAKKYSKYSFADVSQFAGAEAFEKAAKLEMAAQAYIQLSDLFPASKYADGALFNAATDYEKIKNYELAISTYERLISNYSQSPHLKNSLFNIALCYEKLGDFEKVAQTNERFAELFPSEKDAPDLLFSTGKFYMKAEQYGKAINIFRRFHTMYLGGELELEARNYIGECYVKLNMIDLARENFEGTISRAKAITSLPPGVAAYQSSIAQFQLAYLIQLQLEQIPFELPKKKLESAEAKKLELLKEAIDAYQDVMKLGNEASLQASFSVGSMYYNLALAWQNKPRLFENEPSKKLIEDKKITAASLKFLSGSIPFLEKCRDFTSEKDKSKLAEKTQQMMDSASVLLENANSLTIEWGLNSAYNILNSEIPKNVSNQVLSLYIYKSKLLETTQSDFETSVNALERSYSQALTSQKPKAPSSIKSLYAKENYLLGGRYASLAEEMLNTPLDSSLSADEREELQFQFEDIAFELQDKAIKHLQKSLERSKKDNLTDSWSRYILTTLQRLDPQNYKQPEGIQILSIKSDGLWWGQSVALEGWNTIAEDSVTQDVFGPVKSTKLSRPIQFPGKIPNPIWDVNDADTSYLRKIFDVTGKVNQAVIDVAIEDQFVLFLNGKKILSSQIPFSNSNRQTVKSIDVSDLILQGKNLIAIQAIKGEKGHGVVFSLEIAIDAKSQLASSNSQQKEVQIAKPFVLDFKRRDLESLKTEYPSSQKAKEALKKYTEREKTASRQLRSELNKLNFLKDKLSEIDQKIKVLDGEMDFYKKQNEVEGQ